MNENFSIPCEFHNHCEILFFSFICEKLHLGFMKVRTSSRLAREQCRELLNAVITPVSSISIEDLRILAEIPDGIEDGMLRVNNITMNISPNYF